MMDMAIQFPQINPQDLAMENNTCGLNQFSFTHQQRQEKPLQYDQSMQHHQPQIQPIHNHTEINMHQTASLSHDLACLLEKQRRQIDQLLILQSERLKWGVQEHRKRQLPLILKKYEARIEYLLRQKDEEIARAVNKTIELEHFLKRVETDNQAWQKVAKENEEIVLSLNNTIQEFRESACLSTNSVEDAESCCEVVFENRGNRATKSIQAKKEENLEQISKKVLCKGCNFRSSCIIIMPCSHLCLCQSCEVFFHSCPVCGTEKRSTIHALI